MPTAFPVMKAVKRPNSTASRQDRRSDRFGRWLRRTSQGVNHPRVSIIDRQPFQVRCHGKIHIGCRFDPPGAERPLPGSSVISIRVADHSPPTRPGPHVASSQCEKKDHRCSLGRHPSVRRPGRQRRPTFRVAHGLRNDTGDAAASLSRTRPRRSLATMCRFVVSSPV